MSEIGFDIKKLILGGIGAAAISAEKSKDVIDQLVKKGELTVEQGKVLNEELKHEIKEKLKTPCDAEKINKDVEKLNKEELAALKAKIIELEKKNEE